MRPCIRMDLPLVSLEQQPIRSATSHALETEPVGRGQVAADLAQEYRVRVKKQLASPITADLVDRSSSGNRLIRSTGDAGWSAAIRKLCYPLSLLLFPGRSVQYLH
jgi:hypothetical protein